MPPWHSLYLHDIIVQHIFTTTRKSQTSAVLLAGWQLRPVGSPNLGVVRPGWLARWLGGWLNQLGGHQNYF